MEGRILKGHDHFKAGYSYEIVATQTNKLANQGAEEFFYSRISRNGHEVRKYFNSKGENEWTFLFISNSMRILTLII